MQVEITPSESKPRTPLTPKLLDQLPFALEMMRAKEWIFDLP